MSQPTQGRPRDHETTERIVKAAAEQILEGGFDALNYEALAVTAKTSRTTIYRRWPTKIDLGIEVMERLAQIGTKPDTGSVATDLTEHSLQTTRNHNLVASAANPADIWASILNPSLAGAYHERIGQFRRENGREIIAAGVSRGELPENVDADLILDAMAGFVLFRNAFSSRQLEAEQVRSLAHALCQAPPLVS